MRNRGKQSNDDKWFAARWHPIFKEAVHDTCLLLSRGYVENSVIQMVGNRYRLNKRQRDAILRISSGEQEIQRRKQAMVGNNEARGHPVDIDGFNLIILLESALSGAYVFQARDGTYRDISGIHGSYRRVKSTEQAIHLIGKALKELKVEYVHWYLDKPVSNSGRLKQKILEISHDHHFDWKVDLVLNPDKILAKSKNIIVSSDGWVLDQASKWLNLGAYIILNFIKAANIIVV